MCIACQKTPPRESPSRSAHGPNIWEADDVFLCPLVGFCFTPVEQRQLLKKVADVPMGLTAFDLHEMFVSAAGSENPLSRRMSVLLRRKLERKATSLRELPETVFREQWKTALRNGDWAAFLWAAATRGLSPDVLREVYGGLHMAMHNLAEERMQSNRCIAELEKKQRRQAQRLTIYKERAAILQRTAEQTRAANRVLEQTCATLRRECERLREAAPDDETLRAQAARNAELEMDNAELRGALQQAADREQALQSLVASLLADVRGTASQADFQTPSPSACRTVTPFPCPAQSAVQLCAQDAERVCDERCPAFDLCKKRILLVGGIDRMVAAYRQFIERNGGIFEHHTGHLQGGTRKLEKRLERADIILCPINCNSHGACQLTKNLAKRHNKPFHMLPNGSMTTLSSLFGQHGAH